MQFNTFEQLTSFLTKVETLYDLEQKASAPTDADFSGKRRIRSNSSDIEEEEVEDHDDNDEDQEEHEDQKERPIMWN